MDDLAFASLAHQARLLRRRDVSAIELADIYLRRIEAFSADLKAYISVDADAVRKAARVADDQLARLGGDAPPLTGLCFAIKDVIDTADLPTTCGSAAFADHRPEHDAACVASLRAAGAIALGKVNTFEFALTAPSPVYGNAVNPWGAGLSAGGSSNGSGVAVAAALAPAALGTDTGGSVRVPASSCGVVGFKPTFGLIATAGVNPIAHSIDHVGVLTRSASDARLLVATMAGPRELERTEFGDLSGLRIGRAPAGEGLFGAALPDVQACLDRAASMLADAGARVEPVILPDTSVAPAIWVTLASAEAAAWHRTYHDRWDRYGPVARHFVESGLQVAASDTQRATAGREALRQAFDAVMERFDVLLLPTTLTAAIGSAGQFSADEQPMLDGRALSLMESVVGTVMPFDLTGQPAIALPAGLTGDGRPLSIQLVGRRGQDALLLSVAEQLEAKLNFRSRPPRFEAAPGVP
jgi:aspartyl-tRNA(Asn)/glutamyl-tRNA(Gln) amidotransferase subunit A